MEKQWKCLYCRYPLRDGAECPMPECAELRARARVRMGVAVTLTESLAAFGFLLQSTGGNCTAFIRTDGEISEIITCVGEPCAPESLTDQVDIGTEAIEDRCDGMVTRGYTLADVIAALCNPSDKYYLLDLRLHNGFHKGASR